MVRAYHDALKVQLSAITNLNVMRITRGGGWLEHIAGCAGLGIQLVLTSPQSRVILGPFDIHVDIGVLAEKEVIQ